MHHHLWKTPIEIFNGDKPDVSYFKIFGSHAYVFIPPEQQRDKLSPKAKEMVFIGYEPNTKRYYFWSTARHKMFISTHMLFDEIVFPFCSRIKQMDLLLFLSKKKDQQHMTNLP